MQFTKTVNGRKWAVVYDKAIRDDGSLLFPELLTREFLQEQREAQGSYIYAHQYMNEIIPGDDQDLKKEWLKYYTELPEIKTTFAFIDPAISLEDTADYTALVVVDIDVDGVYYLKVARRMRITATQTVKLIFDVNEIFKPNAIGVEGVAYQAALMHFVQERMRHDRIVMPIVDVKRGPDKSKNMRIRSLVPRFEWQKILIKPGLTEFEDEYLKFPRGSFVDILDALASIEEIAYPPVRERKPIRDPHPLSQEYERELIRKTIIKKNRETQEGS